MTTLLGFEQRQDEKLTRTEAYEDIRNAIEDLMEARRGIATKLSLKRASTKAMDTMTKMMSMVPNLIRDWQESPACGAVAPFLVMCKAHFPTMDLANIARVVPKATNVKKLIKEFSGFNSLFSSRVNHEEWYEKHEFPADFSQDDEEDEEEVSGSSASPSGIEFGKDNTFNTSEEDKPESSN
jgi:hypothetical protein